MRVRTLANDWTSCKKVSRMDFVRRAWLFRPGSGTWAGSPVRCPTTFIDTCPGALLLSVPWCNSFGDSVTRIALDTPGLRVSSNARRDLGS